MDFDSKNLTVARGKILFAKFKPGTQIPGPYLELGNCPEFTFARNQDFLDHFSSQIRGVATRDERIPISTQMTATITCDDISNTNMAYWFLSETTTVTQTALTAQTETFEDVLPGCIVQLGQTNARPAGFRKVTVSSVTSTGGSPTTYDVNDDYVVDADLGLITILEGGAITSGSDIIVTFNVAVASHTQIAAGSTMVEGALKFISFNAVGPDADIYIPRATVEPNGDLSLLSDPQSPSWLSIPLTFTALQKGTMALAYRDNRPA